MARLLYFVTFHERSLPVRMSKVSRCIMTTMGGGSFSLGTLRWWRDCHVPLNRCAGGANGRRLTGCVDEAPQHQELERSSLRLTADP